MITTINVGGDLLKQVDELVETEGYKSRSDVFRTGLKELLDSKREQLSGDTKCVLILSHRKEKESNLNRVKHGYEELVETQIHTHLGDKLCTELFVLSGDGARINDLVKDFRKNGAEKIVLI